MTHANNQLEVSDLDFQNIKNSLINYLKKQNTFSDYEFEGSNLQILIDLLAYNTHYMTYYLNMVGNEMFLDTAQLRNNVVSRSKALGYTPVSARGATATLDLTVTPSNTDIVSVTVPKNLEFTTEIDDDTLTFVTPQAYNISERNNNNEFNTQIEVVEGRPLTHKFTVTNNDNIFTLPNQNVDTRSISVEVQESSTNPEKTTFTKASNINSITSDSYVFFVQESENNQYQIEFGDGVLGKKLINGNIVIVNYRVCNDEQGNGARTFSLNDSVDGHSNVSFTVVQSARGGIKQENIDSIKFNAPKKYSRQDRLVTKDDFTGYIKEQYPEFQSISVWGGEDNNPPVYGKVFISIKPQNSEIISSTTKNNIEKTLKNKNTATIGIEFVDAEFIYLEIDTIVKFDQTKTSLTTGALDQKIQNSIIDYGEKNLGRFGNKFRYSKIVRAIDDTDTAINGNLTQVRMQKRFTPNLNKTSSYTLNYKNPIKGCDITDEEKQEGQVYSNNSFRYKDFDDVFIEDDGVGNLLTYRKTNNRKIVIEDDIGSVDYNNGIVTIDSLNITDVNNGSDIEMIARPSNFDVKPLRNTILLIDKSKINIKMVEDGDE